MKFEFDSNNATELRAVEAAVAVLLDRLPRADDKGVVEKALAAEADPLVPGVPEELKGKQLMIVRDGPVVALPDPLEAEPVNAQDVFASDPPPEELDSAGQPWNPDLHSSSRAKVADGTWKKKRGVKPVAEEPREHVPATPEQAEEIKADMAAAFSTSNPPAPPVPPAPAVPMPPAPQADGLVTMNDIWALVTNGKTTINVVLEAAQRMGFADLGKVAQTATAEQRAALLKELTA